MRRALPLLLLPALVLAAEPIHVIPVSPGAGGDLVADLEAAAAASPEGALLVLPELSARRSGAPELPEYDHLPSLRDVVQVARRSSRAILVGVLAGQGGKPRSRFLLVDAQGHHAGAVDRHVVPAGSRFEPAAAPELLDTPAGRFGFLFPEEELRPAARARVAAGATVLMLGTALSPPSVAPRLPWLKAQIAVSHTGAHLVDFGPPPDLKESRKGDAAAEAKRGISMPKAAPAPGAGRCVWNCDEPAPPAPASSGSYWGEKGFQGSLESLEDAAGDIHRNPVPDPDGPYDPTNPESGTGTTGHSGDPLR